MASVLPVDAMVPQNGVPHEPLQGGISVASGSSLAPWLTYARALNNLQLQFLMLIFAGWVNRSQQEIIEYLQEENRVLREQLGGRRLRFIDRQRSRLAAKAKAIGRKGLFEITRLVTPDTLLRWHRRRIAKKYEWMKQIARNLTDADDGFLNGTRHLRKAVKEYTEHYPLERNHQGLDNELIEKPSDKRNMSRPVECQQRLGGVLNYDCRRAA